MNVESAEILKFTLTTGGTPALAHGHLFEVRAADSRGREIVNSAQHEITLRMVGLASGVKHTRLSWRHDQWGWIDEHTVMLAPPSTGHGLARAFLHWEPADSYERNNRTRYGLQYQLSLIVPQLVGQAAELRAAQEAARLAEARRKDLINAMHGLLKAHQ